MGRSTPRRWLSAWTSAGLANGPSTLRPMSPGSSCEAAKMSTLNTTSVTSARANRFSRKRAMTVLPNRTRVGTSRLAERRVPEEHRALGVGRVTLNRWRPRGRVIVEVGEDDRRVLQEDRLGLLRILPLV